MSRVRVGTHLPNMFAIQNGLKQGDALSPMHLNFALAYVSGKPWWLEIKWYTSASGLC